jgi:hypothetical protein
MAGTGQNTASKEILGLNGKNGLEMLVLMLPYCL